MKLITQLFLLTLFLIATSSFALLKESINVHPQTQKDLQQNLLKQLQGTWIHDEDKKATVLVKKRNWTFNYIGEKPAVDDKYSIIITRQVPQFSDKTQKTDFLMLSSKSDTLQYEILGLTDETLSLMYLPNGNLHLYSKQK